MERCDICGRKYEGSYCPYCDENYPAPKKKITGGRYIKNTESAGNDPLLEIYRKNNLIARETPEERPPEITKEAPVIKGGGDVPQGIFRSVSAVSGMITFAIVAGITAAVLLTNKSGADISASAETAYEAQQEAYSEETGPVRVSYENAEPLTAKKGESSVLTEKLSVCYKISAVESGRFVRADLRIQALSDDVTYFYPRAFSLVANIPNRSPAISALPVYYTGGKGQNYEFDGRSDFAKHDGDNNDKLEFDDKGYLEISMLFIANEDSSFSVSDYNLYDSISYSVSEDDRRYDYTDSFNAEISFR